MKSKKFVLAGLVLLAITGLLALAGCKNDTVPEPTRYTVKFETAHGTVPPDITVESGQKVAKPEDPTKDGWMFLGWYEDSGLTKEFDFSTLVTADTTLYAAWNGRDSDGIIVLRNKGMSKTSEVQVLSTKVPFASLYKDGVDSKVFISDRKKEIQPFVMGQYEVTQQLYFAVMGSNPSNFKTGTENEEPKEGGLPVETVSWYDAVVFCNKLSELMGLEPVYSKDGKTDTSGWGEVPTSSDDGWNKIECNWNANGYRLPTEAEWELAARGGKPEEGAWQYTYAGTNEESTLGDYAWYSKNSGNEAGEEKKTHQVGTKKPNSLNLYDMSGNVWEWCWDRWDDGSIDADTPSGGAASGFGRVYRGGCWGNFANNCTVSLRSYSGPSYRDFCLGFRLVRSAN